MPLKILLVEDNRTNLNLMLRYLKKLPSQVEVAMTGLEAVEKAKVLRPGLILMDLGLPDIDGWEATKRIRAQEELAKIPIFIVSANVRDEDKKKAIRAGAQEFIEKPVNFELLKEKIFPLL